ncbi:hypothetical protein ACWDZ6_06150 [Streptomyces sp. NPDC002926]
MDQGIAGLVGAALGGFIGVAGTLASVRLTGRDQRRNQHEHWRRQQRRDAYSQLISQASEAIRLGGNATAAYSGRERNTDDLWERFNETVRKLEEPMSLVALEGPAEAAAAATELVGALAGWAGSMLLALEEDSGAHVRTRYDPAVGLDELIAEQGKSYEAYDAVIQLCCDLLDV